MAESGCWEWLGRIDHNGYGRIYVPGHQDAEKSRWAHRAFYERYMGPIEPGNQIDHRCQNTRCVNPTHLDQVTPSEHGLRTIARLADRESPSGRVRTAQPADLQRQAADLRRSGATYEVISRKLGLSSRRRAHEAVVSAIASGLVDEKDIPRRRILNPTRKGA